MSTLPEIIADNAKEIGSKILKDSVSPATIAKRLDATANFASQLKGEAVSESKSYTDSVSSGQRIVKPSDSPLPGEEAVSPGIDGIFTGFGGVQIDPEDFDEGWVRIILKDGTWERDIVPITLTQTVYKTDIGYSPDIYGKNLFNYATCIPDTNIGSTGALSPNNPGVKTSQPIPINITLPYTAKVDNTIGGKRYRFLDSSFNLVTGPGNFGNLSITTTFAANSYPAGTAYFQFVPQRATDTDAVVSTTTQFEIGTSATTFEPWHDGPIKLGEITTIDGRTIKNTDKEIYPTSLTYTKLETAAKITSDLVPIQTELFGIGETAKTSLENVSSFFVSTAGVITAAASNYGVYRYAAEAGKSYTIRGTLAAATTTNLGGAMFKTSAAMTGSGTILFTVPNGTVSGTSYNVDFACVENGFLFLTRWSNLTLSLYELVPVSKVAVLRTDVDALKTQVNAIGGLDPLDNFPAITSNPLRQINRSPGMACIFHNWGGIGDSLSSGQMEYKVSGVVTNYTNYDYSWLQLIAKACGTQAYNFSVGGQTAAGWIGTFGNALRRWATAQQDEYLKTSYIISLGTNDRNNFRNGEAGSYPAGDVNTDINLTDYSLNANTFAGHMGGIIQRVLSKVPKTKIFVVTLPKPADPDTSDVNTWNNVMRGLATKFPGVVYIIDVYTHGAVENSAFKAKYWIGGHYNVMGYQYKAFQIMTGIDCIVRTYPDSFKEQAFVGTTMSFYP